MIENTVEGFRREPEKELKFRCVVAVLWKKHERETRQGESPARTGGIEGSRLGAAQIMDYCTGLIYRR